MAYYFALNLAKAYLTAVDPTVTEGASIGHGVGSAFEQKSKYYFQHEVLKVRTGVFRLLAERTGQRFCYANNHAIPLVKLLPYLPEAYDLYADATGTAPKLLPVSEVAVLFGQNEAWLRAEVDRNILRQRKIGAESLLRGARIFGQKFRLVSSEEETYSYESVDAFPYSVKRSDVLPDLCELYDEALFATQRQVAGTRRYVVLSRRTNLLSHEAVTFAVLHHLSSMVRYRPHDVERLRGTRHFWLFASWVDRACENFLLALASRITREEHILV